MIEPIIPYKLVDAPALTRFYCGFTKSENMLPPIPEIM